jgi:dehydrogenase/reductase SDR family protein 7B
MKNKVVIITGASSGIGKACASEFGRAGARVVITGRNLPALQETASELVKQSFSIIPIQADVSIEEDCKKVIRQTMELFGSIDVLINNAGISMRALFEDIDVSVIKKVMDINFYGTVYMTKYALPEILKTKGSIVAISSVAGFRGLPGRIGYSASKFAIHGFMESLRTELLKREVHVMLACPGFTSSNIRKTALAADGSAQGESPKDESSLMGPEEVAREIFQGIVKRKRSFVLTAQGKITVWLNKIFPGFMDKMVYEHFRKEENSPLK